MLLNYLKVTLRGMMRNKLYTFINVSGMSVSLACALLLFVYAKQELNYDTHHQGETYRLTSNLTMADGELFNIGSSSVPIAPAIAGQIPEIQHAVRITTGSFLGFKDMIAYETDAYYVEQGYAVDDGFFDVFTLDIIDGNKVDPLPNSNAIALDQSWARKLFGDENPIGKQITLSMIVGEQDFEVTAVYDHQTYYSHLSPNYVISINNASWDGFLNRFQTQWVGNNLVFTYVQLLPGSDPALVNQKIADIFLKNGAEEMKAMGMNKEMSLQPISAIHNDATYAFDVSGITDSTFIRILVLIGVLILLLACVNYINLSTAQAGNRMLEVGVRKVMGISAGGLVRQFLMESFVLISFSLVLGLVICYVSVPYFNQLVSFPISVNIDWQYWLPFLGAFLVLTTLMSGLYPALYISSFQPATVLKGKNKDKGGAAYLRKTLVVFQFIISIVLISAIFIISKQVDFIKNKDLGFDASTKIIVPLRTEEARNNYQVLKTAISGYTSVQSVSGASAVPGATNVNDIFVYKEGQSVDDAIHIYSTTSDVDYAQTLGMKLLDGTFFQSYYSDSIRSKTLINKEAIDQLGFSPEEAVGETVYFDWRGVRYEFEIVGVVDNIHQNSLHSVIEPMLFPVGSENTTYTYMIMDASFENFSEVVAAMQTEWTKSEIRAPLEYFTLNENLQVQYEADYKTFNLIKYFALISILISAMGLYAMSMFVIEKRFKEIGIRKALGARVSDILLMVTRDLSLLILIAFIISVPIAYYGMNFWLETFAYRITPGVDTFLLSGLVALAIAMIAMSYQSLKAANSNPVDVLSEE